MTLKAAKFTPEVMLSATRRSAATPNSKGTLALFATSAYSFEEHKKTAQIRVLDLETGHSNLLIEDLNSSEPTWISDTEFLYLRSAGKGTTSLMVDEASSSSLGSKTIAKFDGPVSGLKVKKLSNGTIAIAVVALANPDGKMANPETEPKPQSTAKVYDSLFVRHWDSWATKNQNSIWYGALEKKQSKYELLSPGLVNVLAGTKLESPVPPFGGTGDFDLSDCGLVFVAKDPDLDPAIYTKTDLYYVPLKNFTESAPPKPTQVQTPGLEGYTNSPTFSNGGKQVAFARMRSKQYESDKPRLFLVADITGDLASTSNVSEFFATEDGEGAWDLRPESIVWSADDQTLYVTAEDRARTRIWTLPASPAQATALPTALEAGEGSVGEIHLLAADSNEELLVTSSSVVDNSFYSIVGAGTKKARCDVISSNSKRGKSFGLSRNQFGDIWFRGAGDYDVHALVVKPSYFDPNKKYPLAMLIHGGPQGAWNDSWSTRWNPAVFAEQGYVVVAPNPTGSTGYGMALQNGIRGNWGGRPYDDIVACFDYVAANLPYVDTSNAVAAGASYGGYMINWIQGNPLGRKFKALVCHDGVFSTLNQWGTEELFFPIHDFEGTLWENRAGYERWDPAKLVGEWATPQLIIHNELDYRLPIPEGLGPFNVLQARGVPSKLVVFPDENHWVLKPENSLVWHREVLGWINKFTGLDKKEEEALVNGTADLKIAS